jgi:hypothetical protein
MMKGREGAASGSLNKEEGGGDKGIAAKARARSDFRRGCLEPASAKDTVSV